MNSKQRTARVIAVILILLPLVWVGLRVVANDETQTALLPEKSYKVKFHISVGPGENEREYNVKAFLPLSNARQQVSSLQYDDGFVELEGKNRTIHWSGDVEVPKKISCEFEFMGQPQSYEIDPSLPLKSHVASELLPFLQPSEYVQSQDSLNIQKAAALVNGETTTKAALSNLFDYINEIPARPIHQLTDAVTALQNNEASCNGKSRLFAAMCRAQGLPSRLVGGIILQPSQKRTSHLWVEVFVMGHWVPFDPLNGHFASIPSNYLQMYTGDEFLITHNSGGTFDYFFEITQFRINEYPEYAVLGLWAFVDQFSFPMEMLIWLIMLPLGALLVSLFKNVVGLKTFGVFIPVILGFSFMDTGLLTGVIMLTGIILSVALLSIPLGKWGIQHTAKISLLLTFVVLEGLVANHFLLDVSWTNAFSSLFFPIVIVTLVSERFARTAEEDCIQSALSTYGQTLLVAAACYFILSSETIQYFVITFPETLLLIAGISILLGKWIGIRLIEYGRFYKVAQ